LKPRRHLVVLTDVDGCLLDYATYSMADAAPAVERLKAEGVPLVLCSSKTRTELERLQQTLGLQGPFVVENGGALYVPDGSVPFPIQGSRHLPGYSVLEFGRRHEEVLAILLRTAERVGAEITSFRGMSVPAVAEACGLSLADARLAKLRDYDEPFRLAAPDPTASMKLGRALRTAGLRCLRGGRFDHVTGGTDKGTPVPAIRRLYDSLFGGAVLAGLGDSLNDLELLGAVDIPVVVRNPAGHTDALVREVRGAVVTKTDGPAGWNDAVLGLLESRA
jgi:mannosyl-3-phosphoglycerate phosphatase